MVKKIELGEFVECAWCTFYNKIKEDTVLRPTLECANCGKKFKVKEIIKKTKLEFN